MASKLNRLILEGEDIQPVDNSFIEASKKVIAFLSSKAELYNIENPDYKVSVEDLKLVFKNAVDSYPENCSSYSLGEWSLARLNLFLDVKSKKRKIKLLPFSSNSTNEIDMFGHLSAANEDFEAAKEDLEKYDLDFSFSKSDDLYLDTNVASLVEIYL